MMNRLPPQNLEAEISIIGGIMVEPDSLDIVSSTLAPEDFYKQAHQKIYKSILELNGKSQPVDIITISNHLSGKKELESIGGAGTLAEILNQVPAAINLKSYADIVKEKSVLRKLISINGEILNKAYEQEFESVDQFIDEVEQKVFKLTEEKETKENLVSAKDLIKVSIDKLTELSANSKEVTGVESGFKTLDKMTAGFQPGDLVIIAARPSMGKTAFSLNVAMNAINKGKTVAYFSVEMAKEQLMIRLLASESRINISDIRIGRIKDYEWPRLIDKASQLAETNLFIDDTSSISALEIRSKCRRLKAQYDLDLILIDYLQIMGTPGKVESRERAVAEISKNLKSIAKELKVPVIALSQLNRGVEGRSGDARKPILSDLRESGSIEQDADLIMMLYREEYYEPENPEVKGQADLLVRKHRNGPVGEIKLQWAAKHGSFSEWNPDQLQQQQQQGGGYQSPDMNSGQPMKNFAPGGNRGNA